MEHTKSFRDLEVYKLARQLLDYRLSITDYRLPRFHFGWLKCYKILIIGYVIFYSFELWAGRLASLRLASFNQQCIQSEHFVVHFTESDKRVAERAIQIAEDAYQTITAEFEITPEDTTSIVIFPSRKEINNAGVQDWAVGQASVGRCNIILIQSPRSNQRIMLEKTIRHEFTHIVLGTVFKKGYLPRWLNEGLAMFEAKEWEFANNIKVGEAYLTQKLFPISCLTYTFPNDEAFSQLAYAQSFDILLFMINEYGKVQIIGLIKELAKGDEIDSAFKKSLGVNLSELEIAWQKSLKKRFNWICVITNSYLIWLMFPVLCLVVYLIKRQQVKKKIKRWEEEEYFPCQ